MKTIVPLLAVMGLALIAYIGTSFLGLHMLFGIVMPYLALGFLSAVLSSVFWIG